MKYTLENLQNGYNIHDLRDICIELGGKPSNKNKDKLIEYIIKIQEGSIIPTSKGQGRKSNREKFNKNKFEGYKEDDNFEVQVNNFSEEETEDSKEGQIVNISGTFEKSENYEHGFLRGDNFKMSSVTDVYVSASAVRGFRLRQGDFVEGIAVYGRDNTAPSLQSIEKLNGFEYESKIRRRFNDIEPVFPNERLKLEVDGENDISLRAIDILSPIGKGQRGLIVAPPKAGKTTLIKKIASSISKNHKDVSLMVVLVGERPEEVTDFKRSVNAEVIYSTFDEKPKNHIRISELAIEKAKRLAESGKDVVLLLDSITRLARAYNEILPSSGKTLTGGIDPVALQAPKSFFGSARNFSDKGSLTIIATALVETGSKLDDVIYEEFKGTGNSEIFLSRKLSERRIFPSIDLYRSGTRREDLLLDSETLDVSYRIRRYFDSVQDAEVKLLETFSKTANNREFISVLSKELR